MNFRSEEKQNPAKDAIKILFIHNTSVVFT